MVVDIGVFFFCHNNAEKERRSTPEGKLSKKESDKNYQQNNGEQIKIQRQARKSKGIEIIYFYKCVPCTNCNLSFPPVAMDLDHIKGEKILEISNMGHYPRWKVLEELEKCEVVCVNCHRIRTKKRKSIKDSQ